MFTAFQHPHELKNMRQIELRIISLSYLVKTNCEGKPASCRGSAKSKLIKHKGINARQQFIGLSEFGLTRLAGRFHLGDPLALTFEGRERDTYRLDLFVVDVSHP